MKAKTVDIEPDFKPINIMLTLESMEEVMIWKALVGAIGGCPEKTYRGLLNADLLWEELNKVYEECVDFEEYFSTWDTGIKAMERE